MRTVVGIMMVIATMVVALSLAAAPPDKPPTTSQSRKLCFELADGTIITGQTDVKIITIRTSNGNVLKVPVADLTELTVGLNDRPGFVKRVESMVKALDSAKTRQGALRELVALGPAVAPIVRRHATSDVSARRAAVGKILKAYKTWSVDYPDAPWPMARPLGLQSSIRADKATVLGTITVKEFPITSPHGRITVKLDDVYRIRAAGRPARIKLGRLAVELRDKTRLTGVAISKLLCVRTRYGTMAVPLAGIQKATFSADGKSICVQCWNSDRIVGAPAASATISLKTKKGRVDISAGKIAVMVATVELDLELDLRKGIKMKLVLIPGGRFIMGNKFSVAQTVRRYGNEEHDEMLIEAEYPQHAVTISRAFYMGRCEVNQAQWYAIMDHKPWAHHQWAKSGANNAANYITGDNAKLFCKKLSRKTGKTVTLPTEAQWEYACRAGTKTAFGFGDDASKLGDYVWCDKSLRGKDQWYPHATGRKKPNKFGLYDMHGNVGEWCLDFYDENFYRRSASIDPENTVKKSSRRVVRGGAWGCFTVECRSAYRASLKGREDSNEVGFRVVVSADSVD